MDGLLANHRPSSWNSHRQIGKIGQHSKQHGLVANQTKN